jgi:excisionase family DNA binding protein
LQAVQRVVRVPAVSVRARRAPQVGQYTEPANMTAKHAGQLTAASAAWQYLQLWSPGPAGAPQFGQWRERASPVIRCSYNTPTMGLMDFIKGEFIDVIEWTDDSRDTLSFRFPDDDKAIKNGAQLIVRESQVVQFVYLGEFGDTFAPGKHTLTTDNIPVLTKLKSWKYGFNSPFKADVYYVTTRLFTGNKWGTSNPIMMRDADLGIVRIRAFGTYDFHIVDPKKFLKEVAGSDQNFHLDEFSDTMRSRIVSIFTDAIATAKIPVFDVASRYSELGEALLPLINPVIGAKYGLEMTSFILENVSVPPEVEQAIDKRSSMSAVGNLNDYVKFQMAQGMEKGGGGAGSAATEMAVGLAMAKQMIDQGMTSPASGGAAATAAATGPVPGAPDLLGVADAAKLLGVSEADVQAVLDKGDLAGKKIGTTWRIKRSAIDEYLAK